MRRFIISRIIQLPILLWIIYTVTFILAWLVPGNPLIDPEHQPPPEIVQAMNARYHLDDPLMFYGQYLIGAMQGDFGPSLTHRDMTVAQMIGDRLPLSLQLGAAAIAIAVVLGTVTGVLSAAKRGTWVDWAAMALALIGISMPIFVTATGALWLIVYQWQWIQLESIAAGQLLLPAVALALPFAAYIARLMRMSMIDVLGEDFIQTARAKGLSPAQVVLRHGLKVAFLPVLSYLGPATAAAMTGSFVVEKVFNLPGMGSFFVEAVLHKDLTLIMGIVLVYATMLIGFNLLVDIAYAWFDPRIELT